MIDKKGRLFGKINVLDLFVLVMLVTIILGSLGKMRGKTKNLSEEIVYEIEVTGIRDFALQYYQVGSQIYDYSSGLYLGKIVNVDPMPYKDVIILNNGRAKEAEKPNMYSVYVRIKCPVLVKDEVLYANGSYELKVGSTIKIKSKWIEVSGKISNIG